VNGLDDNPTAMGKKDVLLDSLHRAVATAIKTEGYVCETLSASMAVSSNVEHISSGSVTSLSEIIHDLMTSDSMDAIQSSCAISALNLQSVPLRANFNNQTCAADGRIASSNSNMRPFLDNMDLSLDSILLKSASNLLAGQEMPLKSPDSSDFGYILKKMVSPDTSPRMLSQRVGSDGLSDGPFLLRVSL
jgi:hypothetical protein